jgi:hypothetical protein
MPASSGCRSCGFCCLDSFVPSNEIDKQITRLEGELKRLEAEYNMFFAGRLPKPPWETRSRVDSLIKTIDRGHLQNFGDRFRLSTLQARYATFIDLWDRGLRAREEGRPGPFAHVKADNQPGEAKPSHDRVLFVAAFRDPAAEMDKLHELYDSLADARRQIGHDSVPFHKFAEMVKTQVQKLQASGSSEVAFRVAMKDGKVDFTARALSGAVDGDE